MPCKKNQQKVEERMVWVIVDSWDYSKDYQILESEAKRLFDEGKLSKDLTNPSHYCEIKNKIQ